MRLQQTRIDIVLLGATDWRIQRK